MLPPFEYGEFILFLTLLFGYIPVIFTYKTYHQTRLFFIAYTALLFGITASNLEAFVLPFAFNLVEHGIGVALAGILFLVYAFRNYKETIFLREKIENIAKEGKQR
jgi:hypothetical protein